jgi:hypothetical protein
MRDTDIPTKEYKKLKALVTLIAANLFYSPVYLWAIQTTFLDNFMNTRAERCAAGACQENNFFLGLAAILAGIVISALVAVRVSGIKANGALIVLTLLALPVSLVTIFLLIMFGGVLFAPLL